MKVDFLTDIGAVRESNQDACECGLFSPSSAWAIVCDGMGGASGGNVASSIALEKIRDFLTREFNENLNRGSIKALLLNAMREANRAVYETAQEREELRGMGTTGVVMLATKGTLHVAHVGDSRAYLLRQDGLEQITMDHSYVQDLVNIGQLTPEEARVHPKRNIITRVLGVRDEVLCDYSAFDFSPGDLALSCSDGLSNYIEHDTLLRFMKEHRGNGKVLSEKLVRCAVERGGSDNITVAVIYND